MLCACGHSRTAKAPVLGHSASFSDIRKSHSKLISRLGFRASKAITGSGVCSFRVLGTVAGAMKGCGTENMTTLQRFLLLTPGILPGKLA